MFNINVQSWWILIIFLVFAALNHKIINFTILQFYLYIDISKNKINFENFYYIFYYIFIIFSINNSK